MHIYILRRLLLIVPTLLGITLVVFMVMAAAPGGISAQSLIEGQDLHPQERAALLEYYNRLYGLDSPAPIQYLRWLNNVSPVGFTLDENHSITGFSFFKGSDLGLSLQYRRPVLDLLRERVPITLLMNLLSFPLVYLIAVSVGVRAAVERGQRFDVTSGVVMLGLWSAPTILVGVLLIGFFASRQHWHWFPTAGLNEREAFDALFLPHAAHVGDALLLGVSPILGVALFSFLAARAGRRLRSVVMGAVGLGLGYALAHAHAAQPGLAWSLGAGLLFGWLGTAIGTANFKGLRITLMGLTGFCLGLLAAGQLAQGSFERGFLLDRLWHLALPVFCLSYSGFAFLSKLTRTAVLENLSSDYARTARAKGADEHQVLWRHVFRNSLLPLITFASSLLPALLAGSIIVEFLFSIDGMGKLAVEAVKLRDRELVLSVTLISGVLTLIGYLITDICYAIADPRVSYE